MSTDISTQSGSIIPIIIIQLVVAVDLFESFRQQPHFGWACMSALIKVFMV